jgi:G3E family GTPase
VIGVLILTGFLGSGKTTLLRHLLRQPQFARTAVIINEFGEIGLDHELVEASDDSYIELATGCLCCKVRSDLVETLDDMLARRDRGTVPPFTRVVIETSGLADPAPILQTLMTDTSVAGRLGPAGVVTTVDAVNGAATLAREEISIKQVALADRLVLTKSDLADAREPPLLDRLAGLNAAAPLLRAHHGRIEARIFDAGSFDPRAKSLRAKSPRAKSLDVNSWLGGAGKSHAHLHGRHHADIQTYAIVRDEPVRAVALTLFIEALAEHCGADLLRLKGIIAVRESPSRPAVIHGVQHVFHPPAWLARWPSADRRTRIVLITRGIRQQWVEVLLDALDAEVAAVSSPPAGEA